MVTSAASPRCVAGTTDPEWTRGRLRSPDSEHPTAARSLALTPSLISFSSQRLPAGSSFQARHSSYCRHSRSRERSRTHTGQSKDAYVWHPRGAAWESSAGQRQGQPRSWEPAWRYSLATWQAPAEDDNLPEHRVTSRGHTDVRTEVKKQREDHLTILTRSPCKLRKSQTSSPHSQQGCVTASAGSQIWPRVLLPALKLPCFLPAPNPEEALAQITHHAVPEAQVSLRAEEQT